MHSYRDTFLSCLKQISPELNQFGKLSSPATGLEPWTAGILSENSTILPPEATKGRFWLGALTLHPGFHYSYIRIHKTSITVTHILSQCAISHHIAMLTGAYGVVLKCRFRVSQPLLRISRTISFSLVQSTE